MPELDGFELLIQIRKLHTLDELPVIISTALVGSSSPTQNKSMDNKSHAFDLGANDFIVKPIVPEDFIPRIKRFL
jgi:CheY-like chemotaxis protein